jgi:hypothetical protein
VIDDADDHRPYRGVGRGEDLLGAVALVEDEDALTHGLVDGVDRDEEVTGGHAGGAGLLNDEQ